MFVPQTTNKQEFLKMQSSRIECFINVTNQVKGLCVRCEEPSPGDNILRSETIFRTLLKGGTII